MVPQEVGPVIAQYKVVTCLCRVICRQQISALSITKLGLGRPWKEITSGTSCQQQKPPKLETKIWVTTLPSTLLYLALPSPQRPRVIMVATSRCPLCECNQSLGAAVFGVEKYKGYVETKQEHGCPVISQLYWLRYICTRDSSLIEYRIEIQDARVQILI